MGAGRLPFWGILINKSAFQNRDLHATSSWVFSMAATKPGKRCSNPTRLPH